MLLLVDDDPSFLDEAQDLDFGTKVYFAGSAQQAKDLMGTVGAGFSVAMIDLDLPGQDGFSLIAEMRRHFPDLPIIAISGVFQDHVLESARILGADATLHKPIGPEWKAAVLRAEAGATQARSGQ